MTRRKPSLLILACLLSVLAPRAAVSLDWVYFATSSVDNVFYYDRDSVKRSGSFVRVWTYVNLPEADPDTKMLSMRSLDEHDCKEGRFRSLSLTSFPKHDLEGVADVQETGLEWIYVPPGSAIEALHKIICETGGEKSR